MHKHYSHSLYLPTPHCVNHCLLTTLPAIADGPIVLLPVVFVYLPLTLVLYYIICVCLPFLPVFLPIVIIPPLVLLCPVSLVLCQLFLPVITVCVCCFPRKKEKERESLTCVLLLCIITFFFPEEKTEDLPTLSSARKRHWLLRQVAFVCSVVDFCPPCRACLTPVPLPWLPLPAHPVDKPYLACVPPVPLFPGRCSSLAPRQDRQTCRRNLIYLLIAALLLG